MKVIINLSIFGNEKYFVRHFISNFSLFHVLSKEVFIFTIMSNPKISNYPITLTLTYQLFYKKIYG